MAVFDGQAGVPHSRGSRTTVGTAAIGDSVQKFHRSEIHEADALVNQTRSRRVDFLFPFPGRPKPRNLPEHHHDGRQDEKCVHVFDIFSITPVNQHFVLV